MKNMALGALLLCALTVSSKAQTNTPTSKIGYADVDYIFDQMPESKQISAELQSLQAQLKKQYDDKVQEFQKKLAIYQGYDNTVPDAVKQNTERELQQMQQNLQNLQDDSQSNLQKKQEDLMQPVYAKVDKNISDVAKENGFTMIVTSKVGGIDVVLFSDDRINISDLVLKKMGITPQPQTSTGTGTQTPPSQGK
jgi:outer membrane protein